MKIFRSRKAVRWLLIVVALWVTCCVVARLHAAVAHRNANWTFRPSYYLSSYGLDIRGPQPLSLGSDIVGAPSAPTVDPSSPSFILVGTHLGSISGFTEPASPVHLKVVVKGKSYDFQVPYSQVTFVQQPGVSATADITMLDEMIDSGLPGRNHIGSFFLLSPHHLDPAPSITQTPLWQSGPGYILQNYIQSIVITLTPAQYDAYVKAI
jgi:hypothetical protein